MSEESTLRKAKKVQKDESIFVGEFFDKIEKLTLLILRKD